jgi:hypothetical protein
MELIDGCLLETREFMGIDIFARPGIKDEKTDAP